MASAERLWHLMRRVCRAIRDVREEGPVGRARLLLPNPADRFVGDVFAEVIALLRRLGWFDAGRAVEQNRHELIHLTAQETVELLEARARGPAVEWAGDALLPGRGLMTLAKVPCVVSVEFENLADVGAGVGNHPRRAGPRRAEFGDDAHVHRVVVASGEHCCARWRTQRCGVHVVVAQPAFCQTLCRRHLDTAAKGARNAEAHIIYKYDHHIWRTFWSVQHGLRRGVGCSGIKGDRTPIWLIRNWKNFASYPYILCHGLFSCSSSRARAVTASRGTINQDVAGQR